MATAEEANEYLGSLAAGVDGALQASAPDFTFVLVFYKKGEPLNADLMAIFGDPDHKHNEESALYRAARCLTEEQTK